jgi:hypothetical protein
MNTVVALVIVFGLLALAVDAIGRRSLKKRISDLENDHVPQWRINDCQTTVESIYRKHNEMANYLGIKYVEESKSGYEKKGSKEC